jgi:hypothetical protein
MKTAENDNTTYMYTYIHDTDGYDARILHHLYLELHFHDYHGMPVQVTISGDGVDVASAFDHTITPAQMETILLNAKQVARIEAALFERETRRLERLGLAA